MKDRDVSLTAKAIYAYFCSLSGNGDSWFPSRETIQQQLGIGRDAYYKHRKLLIDKGYIVIEQQKTTHLKENRRYNLFRYKGLKEAGYGIIPRAVMQDPRLGVKEKGLYAYIASNAGAGASAFPSVKNLILDLHISENSYQKYMRTLKQLGYIEVRQRKGVHKGKDFSVNDYYLADMPTLLKTESKDS